MPLSFNRTADKLEGTLYLVQRCSLAPLFIHKSPTFTLGSWVGVPV